MGKCGNQGLARIALLGLCGLGLMHVAWASPPAGQRGAMRQDLHPPLDLHASVSTMAAAASEKAPAAFPSSLHRQTLGVPEGAQVQTQLPQLGSEGGPQARPMSRAEEFTRRVHREGLPVARLWENKSALLSLGLNQKGKPGLWIIQKIH
jgi:hypothetical protein